MIGLRNVGDDTFVETMQAINSVLPNSRFAIPFFAPVVLAPFAAWRAFAAGDDVAGWWCVAATVLSIVTFVITAAGNVPLNNELEAAGRDDDSSARIAFEEPWVRLNNLRTFTSIAAFVAAVGGLATFA